LLNPDQFAIGPGHLDADSGSREAAAMQSRRPKKSSARDRLLAATMEYVGRNGVGDLSLRQLAAAIGTSHRMLVYHFGSKEGLLVEVIQAVEARERQALIALANDGHLPAAERMRRMWRRFADRSYWPQERLFFEVYGQALQSRPHTTRLLDGIVDSWLGPMTEIGVRDGLTRRAARANARLMIAVTRGLLLDLLATRDRKAVDEALRFFIAHYRTEGRRRLRRKPNT